MPSIKVGVIGVGALGRHHARLYRECQGVELVGIHDRDEIRGREVAEELGVHFFVDANNLVDAVDGLSVAVPTDLHYAVVRDLLLREKHVLVEKPITETVAQAEELVKLAEARGLVLEVGHVERFNPVLSCLDDVPGSPRFIESHRLAPYPQPRPGLRPRGTEVSVVLDLMIHDIDVVLALVRSPVERVEAVGVPVLSESEDIANARLVFANGCVANLTASRVSAEPMRKIRLFKPSAYLSLDYQDRKGEVAYKTATGIARREVPAKEGNALLDELTDFCRCVEACKRDGASGVTPKVSGRQGLAALRIAERILAAIAETDLAK